MTFPIHLDLPMFNPVSAGPISAGSAIESE
jgi:hypothetical protein